MGLLATLIILCGIVSTVFAQATISWYSPQERSTVDFSNGAKYLVVFTPSPKITFVLISLYQDCDGVRGTPTMQLGALDVSSGTFTVTISTYLSPSTLYCFEMSNADYWYNSPPFYAKTLPSSSKPSTTINYVTNNSTRSVPPTLLPSYTASNPTTQVTSTAPVNTAVPASTADSQGLSTGAIGGIAAGSSVVVLAGGILAFWFLHRKKTTLSPFLISTNGNSNNGGQPYQPPQQQQQHHQQQHQHQHQQHYQQPPPPPFSQPIKSPYQTDDKQRIVYNAAPQSPKPQESFYAQPLSPSEYEKDYGQPVLKSQSPIWQHQHATVPTAYVSQDIGWQQQEFSRMPEGSASPSSVWQQPQENQQLQQQQQVDNNNQLPPFHSLMKPYDPEVVQSNVTPYDGTIRQVPDTRN